MATTTEHTREQQERGYEWCCWLRSGKYKQGRLALRNARNGMCCLGVACDVSGVGEWNPTVSGNFGYDGESTSPPNNVVEFFGLADSCGAVDIEAEASLMGLNDSSRWSFAQIADVIEHELYSDFPLLTKEDRDRIAAQVANSEPPYKVAATGNGTSTAVAVSPSPSPLPVQIEEGK